MAEKKHTIDAVSKIVREQKYKYCSLTNAQGQPICPFNRPEKGKTPNPTKKLEEIKLRLTALPDGLYYVVCKNTFNTSIRGESFPVVKGNVNMSESPSVQSEITVLPPNPFHSSDPSKVLSYAEALLLERENATLKAEVINLRSELQRLTGELQATKSQLSESPEVPGWQEWADNTLPTILPILDRYFALEDKKLNLKARQLQNKPHNGTMQRVQEQDQLEVPVPGT